MMRLSTLLSLLLLAPPAVAATQIVSWHLYTEPCLDADSDFSFSCGSYGEYHFEVATTTCTPMDSGTEPVKMYAGQRNGPRVMQTNQQLPVPVPLIGGPQNRRQPIDEGERQSRSNADGGQQEAPIPDGTPWAASIDWQSSHGASVSAVIQSLAGPDISVLSFYLDDPALQPLGTDIGDQHLLATLCAVVEKVEAEGNENLLTLGLSLGRASEPTDPDDGEQCFANLGCEIRSVLQHLRALGVTIAAAAGNYQQLLFPALLEETLAVGQFDVSGYLLTGIEDKTWESPPELDVLVPGHGLCIGNSTAPSGSSLSTAFIVGGLAQLMDRIPGIAPYGEGAWKARWSNELGCIVLAQGAVAHPYCNPGMGPVLGGILLGLQSGCWDVPQEENILLTPPPPPAMTQPPIPGLSAWVAENIQPAPQEDPCIPCVDDDGYGGPPAIHGDNDIFLNLTRSLPLSSSVSLDALFFRVGNSFYPVELSSEDLLRFANAELDGLYLTGYGELLEPGPHPSLYYQLKTDDGQDCNDPNPDLPTCLWSSTYIYPDINTSQ